MKSEFTVLLQKVEAFDAYLSAHLDVRNPAGLCGAKDTDPGRAVLNKYRLELTKYLAAAGVPKTPEESSVRKRCLVQLQFLWILADLSGASPRLPQDSPADTALRCKCACLHFLNGEAFSASIDFDTITWVRVVSAAHLRREIESGRFKGKLAADKYSPYYGLENCEAGPQVISDFCVYDMNPEIAGKLYEGLNPIRFIVERVYTDAVVRKGLQVSDAAEKYWFLHILEDEDEIRFRIRFIHAFRDNLRILYALICMRDHNNNEATDGIHSAALDSHGIAELMKAYKAMYDPMQRRAGFVYHDETEEEKNYMGTFLDLYEELKRTMISDRKVISFQKALLTAAAADARPEARFRLVDTYLQRDARMQRQIMDAFAADTSFDWDKFQTALEGQHMDGNLVSDTGAYPEGGYRPAEALTFEEYAQEVASSTVRYMQVHEKLENCLHEKLDRCSAFFREKYAGIMEDILSDPAQTLAIAFENRL